MEPIEAHEQSCRARWLTKEPPLCKSVLLEKAILESPYCVLLCLVVSVKGPQVEIRRGVHLGVVCVVASEHIVDDDLPAS